MPGSKFHPLFMFGFERSGTTLLSMIVGAHPQIAVPFSVVGMWFRYEQALPDYNELRGWTDVERMVDDLLSEERIRLWDVDLNRSEILDGVETGSYPSIVRRFHECYAHRKGKEHWANLDIATLECMDRVNRWFPDAKFVHIVRDGRDVALSSQTMPYAPGNLSETADAWQRRVFTNMKMGAMLDPERYLLIRYEDLILRPEETLAGFCAFIGMPYSSQMLGYTSMVREKVPEDKRWLWPAIDHGLQESKVFRWKKDMSTSQRIVVESAIQPVLKLLDYEVYENIPKRFTAYALATWYYLERGGRFQRFIAKFGVHRKSLLERQSNKSSPATS